MLLAENTTKIPEKGRECCLIDTSLHRPAVTWRNMLRWYQLCEISAS
jgi:hypothetical protein